MSQTQPIEPNKLIIARVLDYLRSAGATSLVAELERYALQTLLAKPPFDMLAHLARQADWSERTFGPGSRAKGVVDHIRKELIEIEADPGDLREWVDVIILAFDGAWRTGATPRQIIEAIVAKQTKNEGRIWPDWRTADPDKAIEHDRCHDQPAALSTAHCNHVFIAKPTDGSNTACAPCKAVCMHCGHEPQLPSAAQEAQVPYKLINHDDIRNMISELQRGVISAEAICRLESWLDEYAVLPASPQPAPHAMVDDLYILSMNEDCMEEAIEHLKGSSTGDALKVVLAAQKSIRDSFVKGEIPTIAQPAAVEPAADPCGFVKVRQSAIDWLKEKYPALCVKAGLCEYVGKRLYTVTRLDDAPSTDLAAERADAARWQYIRRKLCLTGNGNGTCTMQAINLPATIAGWPEPGKVAEFCDAAIDAALAQPDAGGKA